MRRMLLVLFFVFMAGGRAGAADTPVPLPVVATAVESEAATLSIFNRPIFTFRGSRSGVSAADRSARAKERIRKLLERSATDTIGQARDGADILVQIDNATAFVITALDLPPEPDATLDTLAQGAVSALETAVAESRESRNLDYMLRALGKALIAAAVALTLVRAAAWVRRRVTKEYIALVREYAGRVHWGGLKPLQGKRVLVVGRMALNGVYRLFLFIVFYYWLSYSLSCFPYTRVWGETLSALLVGIGAQISGAVLRALPGLLIAMLIFWLAHWVNGILTSFFEGVSSGQVQVAWLDADVVLPTRRIAKTLVWLFALAMAYPYLPGSGTEAFKGLSVLAGLMISLGASNLVGQAASGLILTYGRVFRTGEFVRVDDSEGTVVEMGIFSTRIRTGMGEELTISNSKILNATTRNYSRAVKGVGFVLNTAVTIGYDTAWRQVHAMLIEAARRTDGVLSEPPPVVFQTALSDWYPEYRLVCQAIPSEPRSRAALLSALHANIQDVFNEHGVQIMSPQYIADPPEAKVVPPEHWYPAPAVRPDKH